MPAALPTSLANMIASLAGDVRQLRHGQRHPGEIMLFAGVALPTGWLSCAGQTLQTSNYPALFAALGYTHGGAGTEFSLPALTAPAGNYIIYTGAP